MMQSMWCTAAAMSSTVARPHRSGSRREGVLHAPLEGEALLLHPDLNPPSIPAGEEDGEK